MDAAHPVSWTCAPSDSLDYLEPDLSYSRKFLILSVPVFACFHIFTYIFIYIYVVFFLVFFQKKNTAFYLSITVNKLVAIYTLQKKTYKSEGFIS